MTVALLFISALMLAGVAFCGLGNGFASRRGWKLTTIGHFVTAGVAGALAALLLAAAVAAL